MADVTTSFTLDTKNNHLVSTGASGPTGIDMRRCMLSATLRYLYRRRRFRSRCRNLLLQLENGEFYSSTLREIFAKYHGVMVGDYSYGECFVPGAFPPGVRVGRYVSVAPGVRVFLRNHPFERLSMHPFFYNHELGHVEKDTITAGTLHIEHDAWIGERTIITPGCSRIGIGAVVGAGAVVTKDVADFAIVGGNPAKVIRFRFPEETQQLILASKWWKRPATECVAVIPDMVKALNDEAWQHPLLRDPISDT